MLLAVSFPAKRQTMRMRNRCILLLISLHTIAQAQTPSLLPFKKYPFPTGLTAAAVGSNIAWALDEEGRRNVYVTTGPAFIPRQLTSYTEDDGQEISSL